MAEKCRHFIPDTRYPGTPLCGGHAASNAERTTRHRAITCLDCWEVLAKRLRERLYGAEAAADEQ